MVAGTPALTLLGETVSSRTMKPWVTGAGVGVAVGVLVGVGVRVGVAVAVGVRVAVGVGVGVNVPVGVGVGVPTGVGVLVGVDVLVGVGVVVGVGVLVGVAVLVGVGVGVVGVAVGSTMTPAGVTVMVKVCAGLVSTPPLAAPPSSWSCTVIVAVTAETGV